MKKQLLIWTLLMLCSGIVSSVVFAAEKKENALLGESTRLPTYDCSLGKTKDSTSTGANSIWQTGAVGGAASSQTVTK